MALISAVPGTGKPVQNSGKANCCTGMEKNAPCSHSRQDNRSKGICLTRLCCNVAGFTTVAPLRIAVIAPSTKTSKVILADIGKATDFSVPFWHPPKAL